MIGRRERANFDLFDLLEALQHHFHVGLHDGLAQLAELLHVLLFDDRVVLILRDAELIQQRADAEECAQKGVALHTQLQVAAIGGFFGDLKTGQREDANLLVDDLFARPERQTAPRPARPPDRTPKLASRPRPCRPAGWCG